jgi:hypothetical protein
MEPYAVRSANVSNFDYRIKGSAGSSPNRCDREKRSVPPRDVIADRLRKALRVHSEAGVHANPTYVRLPDSSGNCGLFHRQMRMFRNVIRQKNLWVSSGSGSLPSE